MMAKRTHSNSSGTWNTTGTFHLVRAKYFSGKSHFLATFYTYLCVSGFEKCVFRRFCVLANGWFVVAVSMLVDTGSMQRIMTLEQRQRKMFRHFGYEISSQCVCIDSL